MFRLKKLAVMLLAVILLLGVCSVGVLADGTDKDDIVDGVATVLGGVNVRTGPGTGYSRIGSLAFGETVLILELVNSKWARILYKGEPAYVSRGYLSEMMTEATFDGEGHCNYCGAFVRTGPAKSYSAYTLLFVDDDVVITGIKDGWYSIEIYGTEYYIRSDLVTVTEISDIYHSSAAYSGSSDNYSLGQQIANYALQFVGYSYVYGAESPSEGFDCSGLMWYVYKQFGYSINRTARPQFANDGVFVEKSQLQPGDMVFFSTNGTSVTHVGMYIGNGEFVHAANSRRGVVINRLSSNYYTTYYWGAKRII